MYKCEYIISKILANSNDDISVKGRPHYYSTKREEYAHVKFDLDAGTHSQTPYHNAS